MPTQKGKEPEMTNSRTDLSSISLFVSLLACMFILVAVFASPSRAVAENENVSLSNQAGVVEDQVAPTSMTEHVLSYIAVYTCPVNSADHNWVHRSYQDLVFRNSYRLVNVHCNDVSYLGCTHGYGSLYTCEYFYVTW